MARCAGYCRLARYRFERYLDQMGIDLEGSILDVACGPVSLACLYDDVCGHDNSPAFVEDLAEREVPARLADITELDYPSRSFCYAFGFWASAGAADSFICHPALMDIWVGVGQV